MALTKRFKLKVIKRYSKSERLTVSSYLDLSSGLRLEV